MSKPDRSPIVAVASLAVAGLLLTSWLVGHFAAGPWSDWDAFDWGAATGAATAYGTLVLALVTWRLVERTKTSPEDRRRRQRHEEAG